MSYVDAPELLNGIKGDNLFEEIIPVVILDHGEYLTTRMEKITSAPFHSAVW